MYLISLLYNNSSISEKDVISLISCFCRNYENHFDYEELILSLCEDNSVNNLYEISKLMN